MAGTKLHLIFYNYLLDHAIGHVVAGWVISGKVWINSRDSLHENSSKEK
jgi:hypothetical protein